MTVTYSNITYTLQSGTPYTAWVTGNTLNQLQNATNVIIPETITSGSNTYTVTFIGNNAFKNSSKLASISIPDSIIRVLSSAFENCSQLTAVSIGNTCNSILGFAFNNCPQLSTVTIGAGLTDIGSYAFANCQSLTSMYFLGDKPSNQTAVFDVTNSVKIYYAAGTSGWSSTFINRSTEVITIGATGVASITSFSNSGKTASFSIADNSYTNVELVVLNGSSGVTSGKAFTKSSNGTSWTVTSPALVDGDVVKIFLQTSSGATITELLSYSSTTAVDGTIYYSVDLGVGILSIGEAAFNSCSNLTSAIIGDSVTSMGFYAFDNCSLLTCVTIGNSITDISIFASLTTLTSMIISYGNTTFFNENYAVYKISGSTVSIVWCPRTVSNFIIPLSASRSSNSGSSVSYTVTHIGDFAFLYSQLTSVTIGSNVTHIGYDAFYASQLNSVTIPDAVTSIDEMAFYGCTNLSSVTIGSGLTSMGSCAFSDCYSTLFTSMYFLGDKLQSTADDAFNGANSLVNLYYVDGATGWFSGETVAGKTTVAITTGTTGVSSITQFTEYNKTANFSIADNNYTNVELVVLNGSSGVTSGTAFALSSGNWSVTSPALMDGDVVKVFLQTSTGATVTELLSYNSTTTVDGTIYYSVDLGVGIVSIGQSAFWQCVNLSSVTIPNSVTQIMLQAFRNCSSISSIIIPNSVLSISDSVFQTSTSLGSVTIPASVTKIDNYAFAMCNALTSMYFLGGLPSIGINTFLSVNSLTFYYVSGASDWSTYDAATIGILAYPIPTITSETTSTVSISADPNLSTVYVYTSADSGVTWTTNSVAMFNGSGTLSGSFTAGTLVSTIANIYDDTSYANYCKTVTNSTPTPSSNVCFPAKTPIITNQGPINIEDINPKIHTIRNKKIVAITKTVAHDKNLVRIAKNALGHLYPEKTTLISQNHKVFYQGKMIKAKHLVDDCNVTLVPYNGQVLYNVLLEEHEKMQVNNLIVETLHPEHKVAKLYRFLKNVDSAHHGKFIAAFNKKDLEHRSHFHF